MKPNESPSIFPKQGRDLRVLQEEDLLHAFEDKPKNQMLSSILSVCFSKIWNAHAIFSDASVRKG